MFMCKEPMHNDSQLDVDVTRQRFALMELELKTTEMVQTVTTLRSQLSNAERTVADKASSIVSPACGVFVISRCVDGVFFYICCLVGVLFE